MLGSLGSPRNAMHHLVLNIWGLLYTIFTSIHSDYCNRVIWSPYILVIGCAVIGISMCILWRWMYPTWWPLIPLELGWYTVYELVKCHPSKQAGREAIWNISSVVFLSLLNLYSSLLQLNLSTLFIIRAHQIYIMYKYITVIYPHSSTVS